MGLVPWSVWHAPFTIEIRGTEPPWLWASRSTAMGQALVVRIF